MKIIQLVYNLGSGGAEKFVVNLSNELSSRGYDVEICALNTDEGDIELRSFNIRFIGKGVKYHSLGFKKPGFSLRKVIAVCKYLRRSKADIVHCHLNVIPFIYPLALFSRIRFVHTIHSVAAHATGKGLQFYSDKLFYRIGKIKPVAISEECRKSFDDLLRVNPVCIENGSVSIAPSQKYNEVKREIESYCPSDKTIRFIHVARLSKEKRQEVLVEAFNRLEAKGVDFVLLVLGAYYDSPDGKKLKENACSRIHFLGMKPNVGDYLLESDAFCLTSEYEGLPISLLEALSAGCTPVCTPAGGVCDVVEDGVYGYLSDGFGVADYLNALNRYVSNPISRNKLSEYFDNNFSMSVCAGKYIGIYEEMLRKY